MFDFDINITLILKIEKENNLIKQMDIKTLKIKELYFIFTIYKINYII